MARRGDWPVSTVDAELEVTQTPVQAAGLELTEGREARVGDMAVRRLLPLRLRRTVGAWCFVDHYGPMSVDGMAGMRVPPHPHIGLQTVTWLIAGNVLHRDSLGSEQMIRPGQLNLMTAGRGIAHAEESPAEHDPSLHGVQLWVALPDASRHTEPAFSHHAELPSVGIGGFEATVFVGSLGGARSPALTFSEIVGAELTAFRDASGRIPLAPAHEHVIFVATGCGRNRAAARAAAVPGHRARSRGRLRPRGEPAVPAGRRSAGRAAADVVELRRAHPGGDHGRGGRLAGRTVRGGRRLRRRADASAAAGCRPAQPQAIEETAESAPEEVAALLPGLAP
jgi:quercetin 2,3-dioxygenase